VKATLGSETDSKTVSFFVDSKEPRIRDILPEDGEIIPGSNFYIKYTEDNLESVKLYWKEDSEVDYNEEPLVECVSGTNEECDIDVPLGGHDGDKIDFYFELKDPANTVESEVRTITIDDTDPVVTIVSPVHEKIYAERRVELTVGVDEPVETLEYSLDDGRFRRLCSDCDEYDRRKSFRDGEHTLIVRGTDYAGNAANSSVVSFSVDSREPRITRQYPRNKQYTNGTFIVRYREENLKDISLFYKGVADGDYTEVKKEDCLPGRREECIFDVDLTAYDGFDIFYYFVVRDYATETEGDVYTETVDTTVPIITINAPTPGFISDSRRVRLDIDVTEDVTLEYSDNSGSFRSLCRNCDDYDRRHSFSDGSHTVVLMATDKAGNEGFAEVFFTVER